MAHIFEYQEETFPDQNLTSQKAFMTSPEMTKPFAEALPKIDHSEVSKPTDIETPLKADDESHTTNSSNATRDVTELISGEKVAMVSNDERKGFL
jgi:hypothetical protein